MFCNLLQNNPNLQKRLICPIMKKQILELISISGSIFKSCSYLIFLFLFKVFHVIGDICSNASIGIFCALISFFLSHYFSWRTQFWFQAFRLQLDLGQFESWSCLSLFRAVALETSAVFQNTCGNVNKECVWKQVCFSAVVYTIALFEILMSVPGNSFWGENLVTKSGAFDALSQSGAQLFVCILPCFATSNLFLHCVLKGNSEVLQCLENLCLQACKPWACFLGAMTLQKHFVPLLSPLIKTNQEETYLHAISPTL